MDYKVCPHYDKMIKSVLKDQHPEAADFELNDVHNCKKCFKEDNPTCSLWNGLMFEAYINKTDTYEDIELIIQNLDDKANSESSKYFALINNNDHNNSFENHEDHAYFYDQKPIIDSKLCPHYKEILFVLSEIGDMEYVNFNIDEVYECSGCNEICEWWYQVAYNAGKMMPQIGRKQALLILETLRLGDQRKTIPPSINPILINRSRDNIGFNIPIHYKSCPHYEKMRNALAESGDINDADFDIKEVKECTECSLALFEKSCHWMNVFDERKIGKMKKNIGIMQAQLIFETLWLLNSNTTIPFSLNAIYNFQRRENYRYEFFSKLPSHYSECPHHEDLAIVLAEKGKINNNTITIDPLKNCKKCSKKSRNSCDWFELLASKGTMNPKMGKNATKFLFESLDREVIGIAPEKAHIPGLVQGRNLYTKSCPHYKECPHYDDLLTTLADSGNMEEVGFDIEDTHACFTCTDEENDMCEWWFKIASSEDVKPQMGMTKAKFLLEMLEFKMRKTE